MPAGPPPLGAAALRDTLDAVARAPAFSPSLREQLLALAGELLGRAWRALAGGASRSPALFWAAAVAAAVAVAWLAARAFEAREVRRREAGGGGADAREAPLAAADRAAAAGRFAEAVHLLYAAAVEALAARGLARPHPAKTAGDYAREARRRAAASAAGAADGALPGAAAAFARFARGFEAVAYGPRAADRAAFDALRTAAAPLLARAR